jgi:CRISPR-associated protein Csb2
MLAIDVELLLGTIRAGSAEDIAITGDSDPGEWPPSPSRLLAALVAADGTGPRMRATTGVELALLEQADPPLVVCDRAVDDEEGLAAARTGLLRSSQNDRFVVVDANARGSTVQEYPLRKAEAVRRSTVLAPRTPRITYVWPGVRPAPAEIDGLRARAARIGYFGCADSPVRVTVRLLDEEEGPVQATDGRAVWRPDEEGDVFVETPYAGMVDDLDRQFAAFTGGQWVRRAHLPPNRTPYRMPAPQGPVVVTPMPAVIWLDLARSIAGRHVLRLTEALRAATISHLQELRGPGADLPFEVTGHGAATAEWDQVQFLALPNVGYDYSDGRVHGLAVAIPERAPAALVEEVRAAVARITDLRLAGGQVVHVEPHRWGARTAANPARWTRPSRRFVSAFPVVQDRFTKGGPSLDDVARWCAQAHLPPPVDAQLHPLPFARGAVELRPHEAVRSGKERRPYTHLAVELSSLVRGPIALGHLRSFGLGLLAPPAGREEGGHD